MRFVERTRVPPPPSLAGPSAAVGNERQRAAIHFANAPPAPDEKFEFREYRGYDVRQALSQLFHDKCAYCEAEIGAVGAREVEHFRPKGKVDGVNDHAGYWWLALKWDNLLPSCPDCNKRRRQHIIDAAMTADQVAAILSSPPRLSWGKGMQFPINGARAKTPLCPLDAEDPLVIDPTREDPKPHLAWHAQGDYSVVLAARIGEGESAYGRETIKVFALNRVALVQSRTRMLSELRYHRTQVIETLNRMAEDGDPGGLRLAAVLERIESMKRLARPHMPYSAMVDAFVTDLEAEVRESYDA